MYLNKHFLFVIGAPALLVLLVVGAGIYRLASVEEDTDLPAQEVMEHVVQEEGVVPQQTERVAAPQKENALVPPAEQASTTSKQGIHFSGTLQKVNTGCFSDGECFVIVNGKHVTALRGWSQEVVGAVQGVDGFGDLEKHIGEQIEVYAYGTGDRAYTLYGNNALYIRVASSSAQSGAATPASTANLRPQVQ